MQADVFLAAFLGCLLALGCVAIGVWQFTAWKARRFLKKNVGDLAGWLESSADGDPQIRAELDRMVRRRAHGAPITTTAPEVPTRPQWIAACDRPTCQRTQKIPPEIVVPLEADQWLASIGWRVEGAPGADAVRVTCPECAPRVARS